MEQKLLTDFDHSAEYEFLKVLGLIDDDESKINDRSSPETNVDLDDESEFETDGGDSDLDGEFEADDDDWGIRDGYDFIARFGRDAWDKFYQARKARHRKIVLREFTTRLPNISEQAKNGLFDIFTESSVFGVMEHNALLDALADPIKGWNLQDY